MNMNECKDDYDSNNNKMMTTKSSSRRKGRRGVNDTTTRSSHNSNDQDNDGGGGKYNSTRNSDSKSNSNAKMSRKGNKSNRNADSHFKNSSRDKRSNNNNRKSNKNGNRTDYINTTATATNNNNNNNNNRQLQRNEYNRSNSTKSNTSNKRINYPNHIPIQECLNRYMQKDKLLIRGKLRVIPGGAIAFVSCDRGFYNQDVVINGEIMRNRSLDGDIVFVQITGTVSETSDINNSQSNFDSNNNSNHNCNSIDYNNEEEEEEEDYEQNLIHGVKVNVHIDNDNNNNKEEDHDKHDEHILQSLWDPIISISKKSKDPKQKRHFTNNISNIVNNEEQQQLDIQYTGEVVCIVIPKSSILSSYTQSEIDPTNIQCNDNKNMEEEQNNNSNKYNNNNNINKNTYMNNSIPTRTIVGTIMPLPGNNNSNRCLLVPNSRSLPRFMTPNDTKEKIFGINNNDTTATNTTNDHDGTLRKKICCAEYVYGSWSKYDKWPPCVNVKVMGETMNIEDETLALLIDNNVNHGDFTPDVLRDVEEAVASGRTKNSNNNNNNNDNGRHLYEQEDDLGWEPTEEMIKGRRDYRKERIFTIDPTTAKDLDDALHIKTLPDGRVEIGVHIADVSFFVKSGTAVDEEAAVRSTTVYLVDRTVPMLPRPLCEIACSLNENVERLAFSCVWTMNKDGTLAKKKGKRNENDVWYGRTVIKSCARLDYATAQNIIDRKVANGEKVSDVDEKYWPKSRQPTGGHTIDQVAADVRLMHNVAMARRKLRFDNGALALNGVKLTFQLDTDGQTPKMCAPYPIRDSNRLIEEYMLLANFLVAQRLISHAGGLALLRQHEPPIDKGLQNVIDIAEEIGFKIDGSTSKTLQESLSRMGRECLDKLAIQCVTEMLMTPMQPAEYIAAGNFDAEEWHHFALNIPYYTHFTSPIRRYPDVLVHRLLQATLDGKEAVKNFSLSESEIQSICDHCNDMRMNSKKAQDRSDRVFLSLYLKSNPIESTLGVVVSVGEKAFTVYVPDLGVTTMIYLDEHKDLYDFHVQKNDKGQRRIILTPIENNKSTARLDINLFQKIVVSCKCKETPPIDVSLRIVGKWKGR